MYLCSLLSSLGIFTKWNTGYFLRKTRSTWSSRTVFTHNKWQLQWAVQALVLYCDISGALLAPFVSWFSCNSHWCSLQSLQSFLIPEQQFSAAVGWSMCTHLTHMAHISLSFGGLALRLPFWKWREKQVTCPNKNSDPHLSGSWQYSAVTNTSPHQQQKEERRKRDDKYRCWCIVGTCRKKDNVTKFVYLAQSMRQKDTQVHLIVVMSPALSDAYPVT